MKQHEPESWIDLRRMPPGRRQVCFQQVQARLPEGAGALADLCAAGIAAESSQQAHMLKFKGDQGAADPTKVWSRDVVELDASLDRQVGGIQDFVATMVRLFGDKPAGAPWVQLQQAAFPVGASYYTAQPYVEESSRVATLLAELAKPAWAGLMAEGIMREMVATTTEVHGRYAAAVTAFVTLDNKVSWDAVKQLDLSNHRRLCVLVAAIVRDYAGDDAVRERLLAPIAHQDQEVYEALRERRRVLDVDPNTGEPVAPVVVTPDVV